MQGSLENRISSVVTGVGRAACWLFIPLMALIVFDVVGRRFLHLPTVMLQELQWYLHGILLLLTIGYGYITNVHVRIDVVSERLSERSRLVIELIGIFLFLIPYIGLLFYLSVNFAWQSFETGEASSAAQGLSNRWIIKTFLPIGFLLILLGGVAVALTSYRRLRELAASKASGTAREADL